MKVRVKQAHKEPKDGHWVDHPVGQELEIREKDFAENLHEHVEPKPTKGPVGGKNNG